MTPDRDEMEWQQLEREQWSAGPAVVPSSLNVEWGRPYHVEAPVIDSGVSYTAKPHPKSAYAHIPLRPVTSSVLFVMSPAERKALAKVIKKAPKPIYSASKAHPASYRPDLPLRGLGLCAARATRKWALTAEEKALLADRPIRYAVAV